MNTSDRDPALDPALDHLSRRRFLQKSGSAAVTAALAASAAGAQTTVKGQHPAMTDPALTREDITIDSHGQAVKGYLCRPKAGGKRGGVIVVHEIFGLSDHIKDITCRLAEAGYTALAVNFFTREGDPPALDKGFPALMEFVGNIPDSQIIGDANAAAKYLHDRTDSNGKIGLIGFCWGGYFAMLSSAEVTPLDAAVAYYGRIRLPADRDKAKKPHAPLEIVDEMRVPLLGNFGALDQGIPPADAEALRDALKKAHKTADIYVYAGANHAFNNDTRESYNADAAKLAWARTLAWFDKYLKHG